MQLLGEFSLESSENFNSISFQNQLCWLYRLQTAVAQSFLSNITGHIACLMNFNGECENK